MARQIPDIALFRRTADPQLSSPFFTLLPAEVRNLIYLEFWKLSSSRQHVHADEVELPQAFQPGVDPEPPRLRWSHTRCITNPRARDVRFEEFCRANPGSPEESKWTARLKSEWCLHWECEEQRQRGELDIHGASKKLRDLWFGNSNAGRGMFLDVLRTCKRMYLECLPSIYSNTTFVFTDMREVKEFLLAFGGDDERYPLRSLELCIRTTNLMTEIYYPAMDGAGDEGPPAVFAGTANPGLSMKNNPWRHVCDLLVELPNLQYLHIWFDSRDLRPWHRRVSEMRFFGRLFDVRVANKGRFVLALPELPAKRGMSSHQAWENHYLEGDKIATAPFTVERGPRPNNWRVHLMGTPIRFQGQEVVMPVVLAPPNP
ncbi:hypothetical protein MFIFM68171_09635 [Madurella fahalii]|uniref:DUF7730 domain-containing protein n=1 Tax=Madurella fahalii TaxID=1157608 RepID=A0ABQ0GNV6_9PEZI